MPKLIKFKLSNNKMTLNIKLNYYQETNNYNYN